MEIRFRVAFSTNRIDRNCRRVSMVAGIVAVVAGAIAEGAYFLKKKKVFKQKGVIAE